MAERESSDEEELLANLLLDWEECRSAQAPRTPEEICGERVDLIFELKRRIASLETIDQLISDFNPGFEITALDLTTSIEPQLSPVLPGYQILAEIGRGGMGIVFKALQIGLNRIVAVKTIRHGQWGSPREIARFRSEAEILARLQHPGVVQIHDVLERDGMLWLVLEFVDGKSLAETSRLSPTPPHQAAKLVHDISEVLAAVHQKGILHRDIKPSNILIHANGHVKVTDFGLAKQLTSDTSNTVNGDILGSPSYMAPEQAIGNLAQISERTDVYAIGATLYELLTARPPFTGASAIETLSQVKEQEPVPPRQLVQSIPRDLETICLKCLEKDPGRRYANAANLHEDLGRFISGHPISARRVSVYERSLRWCRRNTGMAALGSITVAALITLAVAATWFTMRLAGAKESQRLQNLALKTEQARAATQEFYARYGRIRERGLSRPAGWLTTNLAEIKAAAMLAESDDNQQLLRTEALRCLCSFDVGNMKTLFTDVDVSCLAHHPAQPILALGDNRADAGSPVTIRLVETNTLKALPSVAFSASGEFNGKDTDGCRSICFTPSGDKLLVGSRLGHLYVWDTKTWTLMDSWRVHADWVVGLAVDPDGETVYTASSTGDLNQWELSSHKLLRETKVTGEVYGLCLTKSHIALPADGAAEIIDLSDFKARTLSDQWKLGATAVAPGFGGTGILVGSGPRVTQMELDPTHLVRQFDDPRLRRAHQYSVRALQVSDNGRFAVSADGNSVKLWDAVAATLVASMNVGDDGVKAVEFLPDGNHLVVAGKGSAEMYEILQHPGWTALPLNSEPLFDANLSGNGHVIVELGEQPVAAPVGWIGAMRTHNLNTGLARKCSVTADDRDKILLSAEGDMVVISDGRDPSLRRFDANSLRELPKSACGMDPHCLTLSRNGEQFYFVADNDAAIGAPKPPSALFICDMKEGVPQLVWSNTASQIVLNRSQILAIGVGQKWLATSSRDGTLRIHSASDGTVVTTHPVESHVTSLAVTHDDSLLLAGDDRGNISLLKLPEATLLGRYSQHQDEISGLVIDAADQTILSSCRGGEVRCWKLNSKTRTMQLTATIGPLAGPVKRLAMSGDGRTALILVHGDTATRILHLDALREGLRDVRLSW